MQNVEFFGLTFWRGCGIIKAGYRLSRRPAKLGEPAAASTNRLMVLNSVRGIYLKPEPFEQQTARRENIKGGALRLSLCIEITHSLEVIFYRVPKSLYTLGVLFNPGVSKVCC